MFGFVGTLIALERAVAVRRAWAFASPGALGLGGLALLSPLPLAVGQILLAAGALALLAVYGAVWSRQPALPVAIQSLGALLALAATLLWLGGHAVPTLIAGMAGFMILTIAGERLELARIAVLPRGTERAAVGVAALLAAAVLAAMLWPTVGYPLFGLALLLTVAGLGLVDVAPRLVRSPGLPRYIALCLLAGYGWLAVAGLVWVTAGPVTSGPEYDAAVHSVFLGFTLAMIMAHAPVIFPAVLRRPLPYRPMFALPVILLNASLVARILLGDLRGLPELVRWGGVANVAAVLLFVLFAVASVLRGERRR